MSPIEHFQSILDSFKIDAKCISSNEIWPYLYFDVILSPKTKIKTFERYADEISLSLKANRPTFKVLYEKGLLRIEFLKSKKPSSDTVGLIKTLPPNNTKINCIVGETLPGDKVLLDFKNYPHLLVAGTTGSGKTVLLHNIIGNILYNKSAYLWLIDPKQIEFNLYRGFSHRFGNTYEQALEMLNEMNFAMDYYFTLLNKQNIYLPSHFLIIDEFADLILQDRNDEFFSLLCRLAQKCRAVNMHIVLSTQRPSVDIIRGAIKANLAPRISCKVSSAIDSKVILDENGAQHLLGKGDALIKDHNYNMERFQASYSTKESIASLY